MEEELEKIVTKNIIEFIASDYGRGFLDGMRAVTDAVSKKLPDLSETTSGMLYKHPRIRPKPDRLSRTSSTIE